MQRNEILNHMDVDELRNYAALQNEMINLYGKLTWTNDDMITKLSDLYLAQNHKADVLKSLNVRRGNMAMFTHVMEEKYKEYLPKPVTYTSEGGFQ